MALKKVLSNQASQWQEMGGTPSQAIAALSMYRKTLVRQLIIKLATFWVLLIGGTYLSIALFSDQSALAVVVVAVFTGAASLVTNIFGTWRELNYSSLVLILIRHATDEQIKEIIGLVLEKL